jgi:hypothetical protein
MAVYRVEFAAMVGDELRDNLPGPSRSPVWDGSQERAFVESVLNQRFNFLLVFVSLIVTGAVNARDTAKLQACVLTFGAVISLCMLPTIYRSHQKLDILMRILKKDKTHPVGFTEEKVDGFSVRWIIGWFIPLLCVIALAAAAVASWHGKIISN